MQFNKSCTEENEKEVTEEQVQLYYDTLTEDKKLECKKKIDHLTFTDQIVFPMIMSKKQICMEVLSLLINKKITEVGFVETEKAYKLLLGKRGIRLDAYVEDDDARYNIEMQVVSHKRNAKKNKISSKYYGRRYYKRRCILR